jgi:hypothetical protein
VSFAQATTVQLDALALTVFDAAHGQDEERWLMPGTASDGKLLTVSQAQPPTRDAAVDLGHEGYVLASRRCCSHGHEGHVGAGHRLGDC